MKSAAIAIAVIVSAAALAQPTLAVDAAAPLAAPAKPVAAPAIPVAKPPAIAPAAKPAASAAKPPAAAVKKVATVSPCAGLDEKSCGSKGICDWVVPKDPNDKTGKLQSPYCRKKVNTALKKPYVKPAAGAVTAPAIPAANAVKPAASATAKVVTAPPVPKANAVKPAASAAAKAVTAVKPPPPAQ